MSSTERWVGTWRPHKVRGPIAALYGSPGPKYALAGLTGSSKHDATKFKAPTFSFGIRHNLRSSNCSPGPSYLIPSNITRRGRDGTPAFSLHSRAKEQATVEIPGPGKYSTEHSGNVIFRSAPAFSLYGRSKEISLSAMPGPASYMLPPVLGPKTVVTSAAPTYSIYGRSKVGSIHGDQKKSPGPAAYRVVDLSSYRQKAPQCSMQGRNFTPGEATQKPGPGAHYPEHVTYTRRKAPSHSFGIRHSQYISPLVVDVKE